MGLIMPSAAVRKTFLLWAASLSFLLFFRGGRALTYIHSEDELCYLGWLYRFLGISGIQCPGGDFLPGIALTWLPAGWLGRLAAWATALPAEAWIVPLVGVTSFLSWCLCLWLLDRTLRPWREILPGGPLVSAAWPLVLLLNVPVLYYATSRTTWSHAGEMALSCATVLLILRKSFAPALFFGLWLSATRINDLPVLLVLGVAWWEHRPRSLSFNQRLGIAIFLLAAALGTAHGLRLAFLTGYNGLYLRQVGEFISFQRAFTVFFANDWGLIFTAPLWVLSLVLGLAFWSKTTGKAKAALLWMVSNLILCIGWRGNGTDFGYRYLTGSHMGALILWLECLPLLHGRARSFALWIPWPAALWTSLLTWVYTTSWDLFPRLAVPTLLVQLPQFQLKALLRMLDGKSLFAPIKFSPLLTSLCSWSPSLGLCGPVRSAPKSSLQGPALWVLTLGCAVALGVLVLTSLRLWGNRSSGVLRTGRRTGHQNDFVELLSVPMEKSGGLE